MEATRRMLPEFTPAVQAMNEAVQVKNELDEEVRKLLLEECFIRINNEKQRNNWRNSLPKKETKK